MTLQAGTKLGTYEVVALLGAGGMGEVYRARDTKLGRDVAIKVLPESFANNAERLARFEREAHLLASLNHPGIATIYGLEEADGVRFLAMELVEGETLAERIAHGAVSWDDALAWFEQMADALHAAHEKGIVHRDLKPANVMLTPEGRVKILDFGLAKALHPADEQVASQSPTLTKDTALGAIVGTAAYMSPEQARGKQVDKRTDVWAFGCVVYEVLTGKKAFVGETVSDTIAAILEREPDWDRLPASLPENGRRFLSRCLKKDATSRLHDIADARIEIQDTPRVVALPARRSSRTWPLAAAVLGLVALFAFLRNEGDVRSAPPRTVAHFVLDGPPVVLGRSGAESALIDISRDGSKLVYVGPGASGGELLYLRRLNEPETVPIPGTEGATGPFFSSDGERIGFFSDGALKTVALDRGAVRSLSGAANPRGASWAEPDTIVFAPNSDTGLFRVTGSAVEAEPITELLDERRERSHRWPTILPGGKAILFTVSDRKLMTFDDAVIAMQSLVDGEEHRTLIEGGSHARYVSTGHLLYGRAGALLAAPFDLDRLEVTGPAVTVVKEVVTQPHTGAVYYTLSDSGTLVYVAGPPIIPRRKLVWVDRSGKTTSLPVDAAAIVTAQLSPSASSVAMDLDGATTHIWLFEMARGTMSRLTFESTNYTPVWHPDGTNILFGSSRTSSGSNLFEQAVDGAGDAKGLMDPGLPRFPMAYTPDGLHVAYVELSPQTQSDIWLLPRDGQPFPLMNTSFNEGYPRFSPDGHWLAYTSDETGQDEIFVQPYPGLGPKRRVSTGGGTMPLWRRDGKELYYRGEGSVMAVPVSLAPAFESGSPHALFEDRFFVATPFFPGFNYDVNPDGSRFLMIEPAEPPSEPERIHIVLNWFQELERLVPTER